MGNFAPSRYPQPIMNKTLWTPSSWGIGSFVMLPAAVSLLSRNEDDNNTQHAPGHRRPSFSSCFSPFSASVQILTPVTSFLSSARSSALVHLISLWTCTWHTLNTVKYGAWSHAPPQLAGAFPWAPPPYKCPPKVENWNRANQAGTWKMC